MKHALNSFVVFFGLFGAGCLLASGQRVTTEDIRRQVVEHVVPLMAMGCDPGRSVRVPLVDLVHLVALSQGEPHDVTKEYNLVLTQAKLDDVCKRMGAMVSALYLANGKGNPQGGKWTRLPVFLKHMSKLTLLDVSNNAFADEEDFSCVCAMGSLRTLLFTSGGAGSKKMDRLPNLSNTQLTGLSVEHNNVTLKTVVQALGPRLADIQSLWLSGTQTKEDELGFLSWMPNLERLGLDNLGLAKLPADFAASKQHLQVLYLNDNRLTATGLAPISQLASVRCLSVMNNHLNDLPCLSNLSSLKTLQLQGNDFTGDVRARVEGETRHAQQHTKIVWE